MTATTTAKPSRPVIFLPIEPTAQLTRCRYCPKMIYFSPHPSTGKPHPIAIDTHPASYAPNGAMYGQGITHYADCAGAAQAHADSAARRAAAIPTQERQSTDLITSLVDSLKPEDS